VLYTNAREDLTQFAINLAALAGGIITIASFVDAAVYRYKAKEKRLVD
jgi:hypothetical protein